MIDSKIKIPKFRNYINQKVERYLLNKVSANQVTLFALIIGVLGSLLLFFSHYILYSFSDSILIFSITKNIDVNCNVLSLIFYIMSLTFILLSFGADIIDGALARLNKPTKFGGVFDLISDRIVELSIIWSLISTEPIILMWPGIFSISGMVVCFGIFILFDHIIPNEEKKNFNEKKKVIYYSEGLMERTETFILLFLAIILIDFRLHILWLFSILIWTTFIQRFYQAYKLLRNLNDDKTGK